MLKLINDKYRFISTFNPVTGFYFRTGVLNDAGKDTGVDPFMTSFPELIDVGVMGHCIHGKTGLCIKSGVQCYQNGLNICDENMSFQDFKKIADECSGKTYQFALGGRGDVDQHENFEEILSYCRNKSIVPNFTSSGFGFTEDIVKTCKKYCGAVAISWYRNSYTLNAIDMLINAGVKTNIHYVLGNNSIDEAIRRLESNDFPSKINAIIFLLHKPIGLGKSENVLSLDDDRLIKFLKIIDNNSFEYKIGFDSCTVPALLNATLHVNTNSIDSCEAARWSMYITSNMIATPCSFDNQDLKYGVDLKTITIQEAWDSELFNNFRNSFRKSCKGCLDRLNCYGGCPIKREIVLCKRKEMNLYEN